MEALGRIIGKHKEVPVILHSSYPQYKEDYMSWAADAYLMKSSDLTELKETIKKLLGKRKKSRRQREEVKKNEESKRKKG
jgi:two-component SAPR family response regulator